MRAGAETGGTPLGLIRIDADGETALVAGGTAWPAAASMSRKVDAGPGGNLALTIRLARRAALNDEAVVRGRTGVPMNGCKARYRNNT